MHLLRATTSFFNFGMLFIYFFTKVCIYLFCRWHGHGCLAARLARDPHSRHNMEQLLALTKLREKRIREVTSARHHTIWECQFDLMMRTDPVLRKISTELDLPLPMRLRDALYGGRTEPIRMAYTCQPGQEIKYLDFCVSDH